MSNFDTIQCARKLNEAEMTQLRTILLNELTSSSTSNPEQSQEEDENISVFLDFVLAMIGNGKTVQYIVDELVEMEMEECNAEKAKSVGNLVAKFIQEIEGTTQIKEESVCEENKEASKETELKKTPIMKSLVVSIFFCYFCVLHSMKSLSFLTFYSYFFPFHVFKKCTNNLF